ncbi:unnamed protein product [Lupinus luteus]|uniref:Wound-responsive family protein n=1 Tax=Lupinus luteus TaxID=3873 RepID=A0AAV1XLI9_LUPLU
MQVAFGFIHKYKTTVTKTICQWFSVPGFPQSLGTFLPHKLCISTFPIYNNHLHSTTQSKHHKFFLLSYPSLKQNKSFKNQHKMSSTRIAWTVAASVGVVEALKDHGICRWNHALKSAQHHLKNHVISMSKTNKLSPFSSAMVSRKVKDEKAKKSEESLRTVMYLSCWGPY